MGSIFHLPKLTPPATTPPNVSTKYAPPNWNQQKALYAITFQTPLQAELTSPASLGPQMESDFDPNVPSATYKASTQASGYNSTTGMNMFVFDAIRRAQHRQTANLTQHPLQTGVNMSDHVIKQPATLTLEVGMSDAIASYTLAGFTPMWEINPSKSVSAYQQMLGMMNNRQLMDINTRLDTYFNMVLVEIAVEDTIKTYFGGLSMILTFQEAIIADVAVTYNGARIQSTAETTQGTVQPQPPTQATVNQHKLGFGTPSAPLITVPGNIPGADILSDLANFIARGGIPGAGMYTSQIIGTVSGVIP